MSLHYLLDGYNIVHQAPTLTHGSLEDRRRRLIAWISINRPHGSARNRLTIVFDGHPAHWGDMPSNEHVQVVFSDGENADECIKHIVSDAPDPKRYVVVSDDKGITLYVRALGAAVMNVKAFVPGLFGAKEQMNKAGGKGGRPSDRATDGKHIPLTQADIINKELAKFWLKDDGK